MYAPWCYIWTNYPLVSNHITMGKKKSMGKLTISTNLAIFNRYFDITRG